MKNKFIIFFALFFLTGCLSQKETVSYSDKQYNEYVKYYKKLKGNTKFETECQDFSIQLITNKISNHKIRYDVIIDQPCVEMKNIKAIAYVDSHEKNMPSIGLLENENFSLKPDYIDKKSGYYKGINLSGITSKDLFKVKIYLTYNSQNNHVERYIILYGDAT